MSNVRSQLRLRMPRLTVQRGRLQGPHLEAIPMDRVRKIVVTAGIVALTSGGAVALLAQGGAGRGPGGGAAPFGGGGPGRAGFEAGFARTARTPVHKMQRQRQAGRSAPAAPLYDPAEPC